MNKKSGNEFSKDALNLFRFVGMPEGVIVKAIGRPYRDFEDALHYNVAVENGIEYVITRNKKDFPGDGNICVVDAEEFIEREMA